MKVKPRWLHHKDEVKPRLWWDQVKISSGRAKSIDEISLKAKYFDHHKISQNSHKRRSTI